MNHGNGNCWVTTINSEVFTTLGLLWLYHARRYPGIRLFVADAGLEYQQRKQLVEAKVTLLVAQSRSHFDMWTAIVNSGLSEGTILYAAVSDLIDPADLFNKGKDRMVFSKWPADSEYYNLCKPLNSIEAQARTANYIEDRVGKKIDGLAAPTRLCGPAYLWKAMVGMTHFIRGCQSVYNQEAWEPLAANLFAAAYPEYTLLNEGK
jgi:hypothetical protein